MKKRLLSISDFSVGDSVVLSDQFASWFSSFGLSLTSTNAVVVWKGRLQDAWKQGGKVMISRSDITPSDTFLEVLEVVVPAAGVRFVVHPVDVVTNIAVVSLK